MKNWFPPADSFILIKLNTRIIVPHYNLSYKFLTLCVTSQFLVLAIEILKDGWIENVACCKSKGIVCAIQN